MASLNVLLDEELVERADRLGTHLMDSLRNLNSPHVAEVRGAGLLVGIEIKQSSGPARPYCEALMERGMLCKETHHQVIRLAPPLTIEEADLDWAVEQLAAVLA